VKELQHKNYLVSVESNLEELCRKCRIIITATPATSFLINRDWIQEGTHITAIGSDIPEKNELDPRLVDRADIVVVDSMSQCQSRGEVFRATKAGYLKNKSINELGSLLNGDIDGREIDRQISIADLTGVAVQDLMISQSVYERVKTLI